MCQQVLHAAVLPYLEALIPHKDVPIQCEADLASLEEPLISLRVLAVCTAEPARHHLAVFNPEQREQPSAGNNM